MPILRLLPPLILSPACRSRLSLLFLHRLHNGGGVPPSPDLSLLEELFPEEVQKKRSRRPTKGQQHIPRLPLYTLREETQEGHNVVRGGKSLEAFVERDSLRQWNISVLVIRRASRSLIESDFRRVAPKGQHIDDWKGLGDILRGILHPPFSAETPQKLIILSSLKSNPCPRNYNSPTAFPLLPSIPQSRLRPRLPIAHHLSSPNRKDPHPYIH